MSTVAPTAPELGERLVIAGVTVKFTPLLALPATVTTTLPVVAPFGTGTVMLRLLQIVGVATTPLNVTVLLPWELPKLPPAMVTDAPTGPEVGDKVLMDGGTL